MHLIIRHRQVRQIRILQSKTVFFKSRVEKLIPRVSQSLFRKYDSKVLGDTKITVQICHFVQKVSIILALLLLRKCGQITRKLYLYKHPLSTWLFVYSQSQESKQKERKIVQNRKAQKTLRVKRAKNLTDLKLQSKIVEDLENTIAALKCENMKMTAEISLLKRERDSLGTRFRKQESA